MNLVGEHVNHNNFGKGVVTLIEDDQIEVEFEFGKKKFLYPDVFKKFLNIENDIPKEYIQEMLNEIDKEKNIKFQEEERKLERLEKVKNLKISNNSQGVFDFSCDNGEEDGKNMWSVFTGTYMSGASKGKPRIPQRLNVNSACVLTMKPEGAEEAERVISGIFMVPDDFVGSLCIDGIINAHEDYRIKLDVEKEKLFFWQYCEETRKSLKWGKCDFKYFSIGEMQNILIDMMKIIKDEDKLKEAVKFYEYFKQINKIS